MATTGTLVNDELNFKFQEDVVEQDPFNFFKINEPILRKGESKDEEGGFFRNNSNEFDNKGKDCFFETYQKVFPNETIQTQDLNDSGEHLNKDFNDIVIDNSNEDSEEKYQNLNIKSRKEIEETHKLFKESNNLEEILHKIDSFQFDETNYNIKLLENKKKYQTRKMAETKKALLGLSLTELKEVAKSLGMPAFTGGQMAKWLYTQHVTTIDDMTNISKANREKLAAEYTIGCMPPTDCQRSKDGTIKYLFPTAMGKKVETVFIPDKDRATLCVSSQVGCKMNCLFCQTGKQGYEGSLSATDILNQIYSPPRRSPSVTPASPPPT